MYRSDNMREGPVSPIQLTPVLDYTNVTHQTHRERPWSARLSHTDEATSSMSLRVK